MYPCVFYRATLVHVQIVGWNIEDRPGIDHLAFVFSSVFFRDLSCEYCLCTMQYHYCYRWAHQLTNSTFKSLTVGARSDHKKKIVYLNKNKERCRKYV